MMKAAVLPVPFLACCPSRERGSQCYRRSGGQWEKGREGAKGGYQPKPESSMDCQERRTSQRQDAHEPGRRVR